MKKNWISFLEENAIKFKDKLAIIDQGSNRRISYEELNTEVNQWASLLQEYGVKRNEAVAFLSTNCLEHLTLMLACSKLGAFFIPLNFRLSNHELEGVMDRLEAKLYLGVGEKVLNVPTTYVDVKKCDLKKYNHFTPDYSTLDDTILMLFTSGSTGVPKGVMFHGEMLLSNQIETCHNWGLRSTDITLVETPFFHTGGYNVLLLPLLYLGGTSILAQSFVPQNVFDSIENEKVSVYFGVPTMFQMLQENPRFNECHFSSIRFFISGGAACSIPMIEEYQKKGLTFKQGFGLTEVGPNCFLLDEKFAVKKAGSIGIPMSHSIVKVVDKEGNQVGINTPGELLIKGPHVCKGYYKNPEAFKETCKGEYFSTGDLVRFDEDGFYFVVGRIKDMYISGGENVYPGEVEKQMTTYPDVHEAVVVAVPSTKWGEVGFAFLRSEKEVSVEDLRNFLNPLLSRYKHPHFVKCLKEFPLLPNGKVDRKELKKLAQTLV
jgi:fatty-acyl-CoA synthase